MAELCCFVLLQLKGCLCKLVHFLVSSFTLFIPNDKERMDENYNGNSQSMVTNIGNQYSSKYILLCSV